MRAPQDRTLRTRAALLDAARRIAGTEGLAALRAEAVAAGAGTAKGTVFAHFPDMDHLVAALLAERLRALPDLPSGGTAAELIAGLRPLVALMVAEPQAVPLMARFSLPEADPTGMGAAIHDRIALMARAIGTAQEAGTLRHGAEAALLAEGLMAFAFHSAASALCAAAAGEGAPEARAMAGLERLARRWLEP